jgi:predicted rRNA methylase YqxC with S4 and FtsJ domains
MAFLSARLDQHLAKAGLVAPVDWIVAGVSFISLEKALPGLLVLARPGGHASGADQAAVRGRVGAAGCGGIVRDKGVHAAVRARIRDWRDGLGWQMTGEAWGPIEGGSGNREFLIAVVKPNALTPDGTTACRAVPPPPTPPRRADARRAGRIAAPGR